MDERGIYHREIAVAVRARMRGERGSQRISAVASKTVAT